MDILLCCEHFYPSVGGVQKMMHEIGVRFIKNGHKVTVATSWRKDRISNTINGIKIKPFRIKGNAVSKIKGDIRTYQEFLINSKFDFLIVIAAQQWTFDAMLPILDDITYKKLHIPCGYSCFYNRKFKKYYKNMEKYLNKFDELIYNASNYRDINYAKSNNIKNINIIYPGASESEFKKTKEASYRNYIEIKKGSFVFLTVGSPAFHKGHKEIIHSYLLSELPFSSTLILNGNYTDVEVLSIKELILNPKKIFREILLRIIGKSPYNIKQLAKKNNDKEKNIIFSDLSRKALVDLYFDADLFLFASHIEYSPLVIFECLAAGLPFISIPVGNIEEIVDISNGGIVCEGEKTKDYRSYVDPKKLSLEISQLSKNKKLLIQLGANGRKAWKNHFTWKIVAKKIEDLVTINH